MTTEKTEKQRHTPSHELVSDRSARKALGVDDATIVNARASELAELLWRHESMSEEDINIRVVRAIEHFNSLKPSDGIEGMLAEQMVGTHFAAIDCLRLAATPGQNFRARDTSLKQAHKLMMLYARQLETLNKHRGKGQQKVTVEHVHVAEGGQAIVGNVETGRRGKRASRIPELEHKSEGSVPLDLPETRTVRQRTRK